METSLQWKSERNYNNMDSVIQNIGKSTRMENRSVQNNKDNWEMSKRKEGNNKTIKPGGCAGNWCYRTIDLIIR